MPQDTHIHFHIHEGASPEAVRAGVVAALPKSPLVDVTHASSETGANGTMPEVDAEKFLEYVRGAYNDSYANAVPLLEYLADNPDRMIPYREITTALRFPNNRSLPGLLGAFGRRAAHRYEGVKPFKTHWIDGEAHLRMSPEAAEAINSLR